MIGSSYTGKASNQTFIHLNIMNLINTNQLSINSHGRELGTRVLVFNATFNSISVISWRSVLLVEEIRVSRENHRPTGSDWQTVSHNVVSSTPRHGRRNYHPHEELSHFHLNEPWWLICFCAFTNHAIRSCLCLWQDFGTEKNDVSVGETRKGNRWYIMSKDRSKLGISVLYNSAAHPIIWVYERVEIVLTRGTHEHDHMISIEGKVWAQF